MSEQGSMNDRIRDHLADAAKSVEPAFKDGDVVYLKSGGPPMTVDLCRDDGIIPVRWFVDGELRDFSFPAECLTKVNPATYLGVHTAVTGYGLGYGKTMALTPEFVEYQQRMQAAVAGAAPVGLHTHFVAPEAAGETCGTDCALAGGPCGRPKCAWGPLPLHPHGF